MENSMTHGIKQEKNVLFDAAGVALLMWPES